MGDQGEVNLLQMCCLPPRVHGIQEGLWGQELQFAFSFVSLGSRCTAVGGGTGQGRCACLSGSFSMLITQQRISCRRCCAGHSAQLLLQA